MTWIVALAILGPAAVTLLWLGLRGRRLDDHPWCRRCKYDLVGTEGDLALCPECGRDLTRRRTVRRGRRRRRPLVAAIGGVLLGLAACVAGVAGSLAALGPDWRNRMPVWVLMLEIERGDALGTEAALQELLSRQRDGKLSKGELNQLVNLALDAQADRTTPWRGTWGEIVESAAVAHNLSRGQWERYARNAAEFDLVVQSPVRRGDPLLRKLVMHSPRVGPHRKFEVSLTHETCSIDGTHQPGAVPFGLEATVRRATTRFGGAKEWYATPIRRYGFFPDRTRHDVSMVEVNAAPGLHRLECRWRLAVRDDIGPDPESRWDWCCPGPGSPEFDPERDLDLESGQGTSPACEWVVSFHAIFNVLPESTETIDLVRDPKLKARIREAIDVRGCTVRRLAQGDWLSAVVDFDEPPVACAFDVYFRSGDQRWLLGSVSSATLGPYGGYQPTICRLREFVLPAGLSHIDVVLEPSRDIAAQSFGTTRIWGEPVVLEGVPVAWHGETGASASHQ